MQTIQQPDNSIATIIAIAQEATRGWLEMVTECRELEKKRGEDISQYMEKMRIQMTRNYRMLMKKIEESKTDTDSKEQIAKKWMRNNLEEAQQYIDNIVGIKGITEDPLKVAAELEGMMPISIPMSYGLNVIAANTAGTLQREVVEDEEEDEEDEEDEEFSSNISPSQEELFGY